MRAFAVVTMVLVGLSGLFAAGSSLAQDDLGQVLFGQRPKPYIDPAGFWAAILPSGFDCDAKPRHVVCNSNRGDNTLLQIDVVDVPASATAELAMLNQMDRFKEKPHFKKIATGKTKLDGTPAVTTSFSYDYQGNVEYSEGVQQVLMVRGGKLYIIHYEGRLDQFKQHQTDLAQLLGSFKPARLDAGGNPIIEDLKPKGASGGDDAVTKALKGGY